MDKETVIQLLKTDTAKLMLKQSCQVPDLAVYASHLQKEFDQFVKNVKYIFKQQPMIYSNNKAKCNYASWFLTGIPLQNWKNLKKHIEAMAKPV